MIHPREDNKQPTQPARMRWQFERDIPTAIFFGGISQRLEDTLGLQDAVEIFVSMLKRGDFLAWEAVVSEKQGLILTFHQKKALAGLVNFGGYDP